jgi:hypothetical protein
LNLEPLKGWPNVEPVKKAEWPTMLLPTWVLANAELFTPVWLKAELPRLEPADMCVPVREPASALPFIREPCILETVRPGEIEELRALLDRDGEDALIPEDAAGVPARAAPAGPSCAQVKLRAPALPDARAGPELNLPLKLGLEPRPIGERMRGPEKERPEGPPPRIPPSEKWPPPEKCPPPPPPPWKPPPPPPREPPPPPPCPPPPC